MSTVLIENYNWTASSSEGWNDMCVRLNVSYDYERTVKGMKYKFYINARLIYGTLNLPVYVSLGHRYPSSDSSEGWDVYQYILKSDYGSWGGSSGLSWTTPWYEKEGDFSSSTTWYSLLFEVPLIKGRGTEWVPFYRSSTYLNCVSNQSKITFYGYPTIGNQHHIQITSADSRYTHKVIFSLEKWSQYIELPSGSTLTDGYWTPNVAGFATNSPDSSRPEYNWRVEVYLEGTQIGYTEGTSYINVTGVNPTTVMTITDESKHYEKYGYYLLGQSEIGLSLTSTAQYGATVESESIYVSSEQLTPPTTLKLPSNFNGKLTAIVIDSRTEQGYEEVNLVCYLYTAPTVKRDEDGTSIFSVHRVKADGTADDTGEYCRVDFTVVYDKLAANGSTVGRNSHKLWVKWEANDGTISGEQEIAVSDYEYSGSCIFAADIEHSFTVSLEMQDDIMDESNPAVRSVMLSTANVIMDWKVGGRGVGIGKVSENLDALDINPDWDVNMGDISHLKFNGEALSMPVNQIIKEGESGFWHYRYWSDGTAECFGQTVISNLTTSTSLGGWYVNSLYKFLSNKQDFPSFKYDENIDSLDMPTPIEAYIVGTTASSTNQSSDWLSLTPNGAALKPTLGQLYRIMTDGIYKNEVYGFTGTYYIPYTRSLFYEAPVCNAQVYGIVDDASSVIPAILLGIEAPSYDQTMSVLIATAAAVSGASYTVSFDCKGIWK